MRIPFFWLALGFSLGIVAARFGGIPAALVGWVLGVGMLFLWFVRGGKYFLPLFVFLLICAGFLWAQLDARVPANDVRNFTGPEKITLRGVVSALPEMKTRGKKTTVSLVLQARSITKKEGDRRRFLKVRGAVQTFLLQSPVLPQVGDELRLYGTLSAPRTVLNPGEFDYEDFLAQKNIHAVFQSIGIKSVRVVRVGSKFLPGRILAETRRKLASVIDEHYAESHAAILKALVLGLRSDVAPEVRSQFMKTGTIHLLAISGLNITMIAGSFYMLFLLVGFGYRWTAFLTILIVAVYVGLAGAGLPVQRAGYASILVLVGVLGGRAANLLNALCFAFFAILLWNPKSLWNVGFQLSFLCVFSLILAFPLFSRLNVRTLSLGSSLAVLFGTFPVVLYHFNIFSPVGILANLAAIPLFDAALFCALFTLIFSGVPLLNTLLVKGASWVLALGLLWVQSLSAWRWGYWFLERPSLRLLAAYYSSIALILVFRKRVFGGQRYVMACLLGCWIVCVTLFFVHSEKKEFELTLLASGRNQIAHANFSNGSHWVLNAGRGSPSDQGEWLVAPFLRSQGVQCLEGVLLSDLSKRNTGGMLPILRDFSVRHLLYPAALRYGAERYPGNLRFPRRQSRAFRQGDEIVMGAEKIRVLAVSPKGSVFMLEFGSWRMLFISRWDPELFEELLRMGERGGEVHAVFLPALDRRLPVESQQWLECVRPLLVVLPDLKPEMTTYLESQRIPGIDLKRVGALSFRERGPRLELSSFLRGSLGFFAYS